MAAPDTGGRHQRPCTQGRIKGVRSLAAGFGVDAGLITDWRIVELLRWIDGHAGAVDCNLEQICWELNLGISPAYAARLFELHTGQGFREYTKSKRLIRATEQLIATNRPVKAIAAELGYRRVFEFRRSFEKQFGLTPTRFRNATREWSMSRPA